MSLYFFLADTFNTSDYSYPTYQQLLHKAPHLLIPPIAGYGLLDRFLPTAFFFFFNGLVVDGFL